MNAIETLELAPGFTARIFHDTDIEQPSSDDDAVRIVVLHRRYLDSSSSMICLKRSNGIAPG
jgi:hypothetical protein